MNQGGEGATSYSILASETTQHMVQTGSIITSHTTVYNWSMDGNMNRRPVKIVLRGNIANNTEVKV